MKSCPIFSCPPFFIDSNNANLFQMLISFSVPGNPNAACQSYTFVLTTDSRQMAADFTCPETILSEWLDNSSDKLLSC